MGLYDVRVMGRASGGYGRSQDFVIRTLPADVERTPLTSAEWEVPEGFWVRSTRFVELWYGKCEGDMVTFVTSDGEMGIELQMEGETVPERIVVEFGIVEEWPFSLN